MERLNYTLVVISTKEVKSVCPGLWFDDTAAAERYAEGITAGLALAGKKNHAVIMHLTDDRLDELAEKINGYSFTYAEHSKHGYCI